jgi:hypothetical protein
MQNGSRNLNSGECRYKLFNGLHAKFDGIRSRDER